MHGAALRLRDRLRCRRQFSRRKHSGAAHPVAVPLELQPGRDGPGEGADLRSLRSGAWGCRAEELSRAQPGAVPGREETCLIGPGERLYHIRELGAWRCRHLAPRPPQPGHTAPQCLLWDREHPSLGASSTQRAFAASGVARGIVLCPSDTS